MMSCVEHKERKTETQRLPLEYKSRHLDNGHVATHNAFQVLNKLECERCGLLLGHVISFDGVTVPARSEIYIEAAIELDLAGKANVKVEWPRGSQN